MPCSANIWKKNTARARTYKEKLLERLVLDGSEYWNIDFLYGKLATAIQMCAYSHTGRLVTMRSLGSFESVYEIDLYLNERIEELNQPDQKDGCSMQDVVDYLNENYFDFISLDALAREKYFMNPRYFGNCSRITPVYLFSVSYPNPHGACARLPGKGKLHGFPSGVYVRI